MGYPRRYYKRTKSGKVLKHEEGKIRTCRWCGTHFLVKTQRDFCTQYCIDGSNVTDSVLIRKD